MTRTVLLDTGPLVALLNRRDRFHGWATEQWGELEPPVLTCELTPALDRPAVPGYFATKQ